MVVEHYDYNVDPSRPDRVLLPVYAGVQVRTQSASNTRVFFGCYREKMRSSNHLFGLGALSLTLSAINSTVLTGAMIATYGEDQPEAILRQASSLDDRGNPTEFFRTDKVRFECFEQL